jgi:hypothetical protein
MKQENSVMVAKSSANPNETMWMGWKSWGWELNPHIAALQAAA